MNVKFESILKEYNITDFELTDLGGNLNRVYLVNTTMGKYVLRIHPHNTLSILGDVNSYDSIKEEMEFLNALSVYFEEFDCILQKPQKTKSDSFVIKYNDYCVTLLTWVDGKDVDCSEMSNDDYLSLGRRLALIHKFSFFYPKKHIVSREKFDIKRLERFIYCIKVGNQKGVFSDNIVTICYDAMKEITIRLEELRENDWGIVHGDFYTYNIIKTRNNLVPIDFGLCSFGCYYQDLASVCNEITDDRRKFFLLGYQNELGNKINFRYLEAMQAYLTLFYLAANNNVYDDYSWVRKLI